MSLGYFELKSDAIRERACCAIRNAADGTAVKLSERKRTLDQNAKVHPLVRDVQRVVKWQVRGELRLMSETEWRYFFAAHIRKDAQLVPNIDGTGFIALGCGTSDLTARECSEYIELVYAFGSERGVVWSEESRAHKARYGAKP